MAQDILFLLAPHFADEKLGPERFYCPECATVEGILAYHSALEKRLHVRRVDFPRPRAEIVKLLGPDLQGAPVLIVGDPVRATLAGVKISPATRQPYVAGLDDIAAYLAAAYHKPSALLTLFHPQPPTKGPHVSIDPLEPRLEPSLNQDKIFLHDLPRRADDLGPRGTAASPA